MQLYTNEIVFRGHPDKVCDQISDAILSEQLYIDPFARCGIEVAGGKTHVFVTGEISSAKRLSDNHITEIVLRVLYDVGYPDAMKHDIIIDISNQSEDIALGTNEEVSGAGDNGMMFGYAVRETPQMLPVAMVILQEFSMAYDKLRLQDGRFLSDGKAQISGLYDADNRLVTIKTFTICYQNTELDRAATDNILVTLADCICATHGIEVEEYLINPTGKFLIGGFQADAGLTGRKIVVDTYQSFAKVGGGAFSGKDPTKVDRSGAYKARELAMFYLKQNPEIRWCTVQLAYSIGIDKPVSIVIDSDLGYLKVRDVDYKNCSVPAIVDKMRNSSIDYEDLARFGHFR